MGASSLASVSRLKGPLRTSLAIWSASCWAPRRRASGLRSLFTCASACEISRSTSVTARGGASTAGAAAAAAAGAAASDTTAIGSGAAATGAAAAGEETATSAMARVNEETQLGRDGAGALGAGVARGGCPDG